VVMGRKRYDTGNLERILNQNQQLGTIHYQEDGINRNTWIIIIVAVIVILGLIWIFNRGPKDYVGTPNVDLLEAYTKCLKQTDNDKAFCLEYVKGR